MNLPADMLACVNRDSAEEAWRPQDFPRILELAGFHRLACIGGQFQFRGPIGVAEAYWLSAHSSPRVEGEEWGAYVVRANAEVAKSFAKLLAEVDFVKEARTWIHVVEAIESKRISDPRDHLFFVAYFKAE